MRRHVLFVLLTVLSLGASVPGSVKNRPLTTGADPIGSWTLAGDGTSLVVKSPKDNGQLYDIVVGPDATGMGKGLSDGDWLYVVYPVLPGSRIALGVFERGEKATEGCLGLFKLGWERWTAKKPGAAYDGTYKVKGSNAFGGGYSSDLEVTPAGTGVYDLVWRAGKGRFEGVGLEAEKKLVAARWGVTVTSSGVSSSSSGTTFTTTTEHRDRPHVWLGAYRIAGDHLEGRVLDNDTHAVAAQTYTKSP